MRSYKKELEIIANELLLQSAKAEGNESKPNYSNRDFMNAIIIFQTALVDKMYDVMQYDDMDLKDRLDMATQCGRDLRLLIYKYTNLDTEKVENFL